MSLFLLMSMLFATPTLAVEPAPIQLLPAEVPWTDASPSLPKGTRVAVLEGNPQRPGIFTMRLVVPQGFRLPQHTHPQDERVTVLRGTFHVVFGAGKDAREKAFPAGSFYVTPAGTGHLVYADEETELQITGWGPWEVRPIVVSDAKQKP